MNRFEVPLTRIVDEGPDCCLIYFKIPLLERRPVAGQFFMVKLLKSGFPLFGRALAVMSYEKNSSHGEVGFLVKVVGKGTALMKAARAGDDALLVGPLGNHFPKPSSDKRYIFVAGGTGVSTFHYLLSGLAEQDLVPGEEPLLLYGAQNSSMLYLHDELKKLPCRVSTSTEDGSFGEKGLVTALLEEALNRSDRSPHTLVYACGPDGMMKAVAHLCRDAGVPVMVSLETRMACGIGVCNGCAVEVNRGGIRSFERVCHEGPVYSAQYLPSFFHENQK